MSLKVCLVDDEATVLETTRCLLENYCPQVEIVGEAQSVAESLELLKTSQPDLLLLDVQLKDGTGFDLLNRLVNRNFDVVFVTGHDEYAIKAFKFSALDYLLKPLDPDELIKAVENSAMKRKHPNHLDLKLEALADQKNEKIILSDAENVYLIDTKTILFIEAQGNYCKFMFDNNSNLLVSKPLKEYEKLLDPRLFFRSHQSYLVNLSHFSRYDKKEGGSIVLTNDIRIPVSVRKKEHLMSALADYSKV